MTSPPLRLRHSAIARIAERLSLGWPPSLALVFGLCARWSLKSMARISAPLASVASASGRRAAADHGRLAVAARRTDIIQHAPDAIFIEGEDCAAEQIQHRMLDQLGSPGHRPWQCRRIAPIARSAEPWCQSSVVVPDAEPSFVSAFRQHCTANPAMPSSADHGMYCAPIASCCLNTSRSMEVT